MASPLGTLAQRLRNRPVRRSKLRLIDRACESYGVSSIADLGGCWGVDGAYLFHAVERHGVERAVEVDTNPTQGFLAKAAAHPQVELVEANFGTQEAAEAVGQVDAVLLYDVLLHQVAPDWDEVIEKYARRARCLLVFNQQWTGSDETVRLPDLDREDYLANVPQRDFHASVIERFDEIHPKQGRPWRDVHHIWQWGITDADLKRRASELGFEQVFTEDVGGFPGLPNFRNRAFLFVAEPAAS